MSGGRDGKERLEQGDVDRKSRQGSRAEVSAERGSVCAFSLGTTESYTKNGEQKERTEWHNVVFFGRLAEIAGEYLSKGSNAYVEGSLKTEKWEDRDGNKKQITKVIGSKLIMLGDRKKKGGREPGDEDDAPF